MIQIPLKHGQVLLIDEIDIPLVNRYRWYAYKAKSNNKYYAYANALKPNGKHIIVLLHRLIIHAQPSEEVDHRDGNGLNNTRGNLRIATTRQNQFNRGAQRNNTTGYKGVHRNRNKWQARIKVNGKDKHLGTYGTKEEAAHAYDDAARELAGEFAKTNF